MNAVVRCVGWGMLGLLTLFGQNSDAARAQESPPAAVEGPSSAAPSSTTPSSTAPEGAAPAATGTAPTTTGEPAQPETSPTVPDGETAVWTSNNPFTRVQELLEAYGVGPSYFGIALDEQPISEEEQEGVRRLLFAARRFQPKQILQWTKGEGHVARIPEGPFETRGDLLRLKGEVRSIEHVVPPEEVRERFQMNEYYRCELTVANGGTPADGKAPLTKAVVYTLAVPDAWKGRTTFPEGAARTACDGFFYKRTAADEGVFVTVRMAWYPPGLLGDKEFDVSLFEEVRNHSGRIANAPFYDLLATAQRMNPDHLLRLTRVRKGARDLEVSSVRDWVTFPWKLGHPEGPSPARRIRELLPAELRERLAATRPDRVDESIIEPLVAAANVVLRGNGLFGHDDWKDQFVDVFDAETVELIRKGLTAADRKRAADFARLLNAHRAELAKTLGRARRGPELDGLIAAGIGNLSESDRTRVHRLLLEGAFPNEIAPSRPYSVYPLFLAPFTQEGRLVELEGVARQVLKIQVTDPEVVERLKIREYFQICLFTKDSQDWPIVFCVRELPARFPVGDNVCELVRIRGFFLQTWRYDSVHNLSARAKRAMAHQTPGQAVPEEMRMQPPSPLLIAKQTVWVKNGVRAGDDTDSSFVGLTFLGCTIVGVFLGMWHFQREDLAFKRARLERIVAARDSQDESGPDWTGFVVLGGPPTFDFLDKPPVSDPAASSPAPAPDAETGGVDACPAAVPIGEPLPGVETAAKAAEGAAEPLPQVETDGMAETVAAEPEPAAVPIGEPLPGVETGPKAAEDPARAEVTVAAEAATDSPQVETDVKDGAEPRREPIRNDGRGSEPA